MEKHLKFARSLATLMDERFNIFGFKFGLDPIIGLIPGAGDMVTVVTSTYIIWIGVKIGVSAKTISKMVLFTAVDVVTGFLPTGGDIFDFIWKANKKNVELIEMHYYGKIIEK